ncbi:replication initiator [Longispora sp. NPDC051575]|uniref:replication initiator n=1 Tax=Longispora sp. NPDC051575 TaxID=3154943 RepID=UPI00342AAC14
MNATVTALPGLELNPVGAQTAPRSGSRSARMLFPPAKEVLRDIAREAGLCLRPLALRRTDTATGKTEILEVPCGARLASKCAPCAEKNRKLRLQQLREGWHLPEEPATEPRPASEEERWLISYRAELEWERAALMVTPMDPDERAAKLADLDQGVDQVAAQIAQCGLRGTLPTATAKKTTARKRSTKRRQDVGDLPRVKVDRRTVGKVYASRDGKTHRPSMLLTVTLDSYGPVHSPRRANRPVCECGSTHHPDDPKVGTPVDPSTYDYRRAALDAIHFARLTDRLWQNLRRAAGFNIQYGGCVELQRRLAPHGHFAIRGTIPRALVKRVAEGTYHQVWWPAHDNLVHSQDAPPRWCPDAQAWTDPNTGAVLDMVAWDDALDALDQDDAEPAHVVRCGRVDPRGVKSGSKDAERTIRYVTKYLTKDITEHVTPSHDAQRAHFDRMHAELSVLPCSTTCANWLLYGIAPKNASPTLRPGHCRGKVHQRQTLGFTGRRVLISRKWSNKTLTDHRDDNRAWVRALLELPDDDQGDNKASRFEYELCRHDDPDLDPEGVRLMRAITIRAGWKQQIQQARQRLEELSATGQEAA